MQMNPLIPRLHSSPVLVGAALLLGCLALPTAHGVTVSTQTDLAAALASPGGTIDLGADIDMAGWITVDGFSGTIDGHGYKLLNLDAPLLGTVTGDIAIRDLVVKDANVTVTAETSGILLKSVTAANLVVENIAFTGSTLRNTCNKGNVAFVVGLFSVTSAASFTNCHVDDTCSLALGVNQHAAIAGNGTATGTGATISFTHCTMAAVLSTTLSFGSQFGGIAGNLKVIGTGGNADQYAHIYMDGCTNYSGNVATWGGANRSFGGLIHTAGCGNSSQKGDAVITRCANYGSLNYNGNLTSSGTNYGGLIGNWSNGKLTVEDCVNYGSVISSGNSDTRSEIGGIVGSISTPIQVSVSIVGCANRGDITGWRAGGLVGTLSHNASYKSTKIYIRSCMNTGTITARSEETTPGQAIGMLTKGTAYPQIDIEGGLYATDTLIGTYAEGASVTALNTADNVYLSTSEGLVNGTDLAALNAYNDNCSLWKQGHEYPILKILPNEAAPDTITATFEDWDGTVLKQVTIARGWQCFPPADPERDGHSFLGWMPDTFSGLAQDTTFTAQYSSGVLEHTVSFVDWDGTPIGLPQIIVHGSAATAPADPERTDYLFIGWSVAFDNVTEDLTVQAQYVALDQYVATPEAFMAAVSADTHVGVTVHLSADIALSADWADPDFYAAFDGAGHTISCPNGRLPLFNHLYGTASNFVLNAGTAGTPLEVSLANTTLFGAVARTLGGGAIRDVSVENLTVKTGDNCKVGILAGLMADGASIERCTVSDTCAIRGKNNSSLGGIAGAIERTTAFAPQDGEGTAIHGETLALIADCTNNAPFVVTAGAVFSGGIVGNADMFNSTYRPNMHILRCANNGAFSATANTGSAGSAIGGIVGRRGNDSSGHGGILHIADCANNADIATPGTSNASIGGLIGYLRRGCEAVIDRCVNRGNIGTAVAGDGTSTVTGNHVGGLFGQVSSLYSGNPIMVTNSANYGTVTAGSYAGGLVGGFDANTGHGDTKLMFYNCANYGAVVGTTEQTPTGQLFAKFGATVADSPNRQYGAVNSFFMTDDLYADDSGSTIILEGIVTAEDEGYKAAAARRQLNLAVAESDGAYETWMVGKIGPELLPFWDHYTPSTVILFQ